MGLRAVEIARSAMAAQRKELELIAHNMANIRTPGYNRRRAVLVPLTDAATPGMPRGGMGVDVAKVERLGDRLLEAQINVEAGRLGREQVVATGLRALERAVAGDEGRGLLDALNDLFDAFSSVAADPAGLTPRREALARAEVLCDSFRRSAQALRQALETNDQQVVTVIDRANLLARTVADYNRSLGAAGGPENSPDLVGQRALAVAELAKLTGAVAVARDNGYVDVLLGGHYLVQGELVSELETQQVAGHPPLHEVSFNGQSPPDGMEGELAGLLALRTAHLQPARDSLNQFAVDLASQVNARHAAGYDLDGNPGESFFVYNPADPAETLSLNGALAGSPRLLAASSVPGQDANGENALSLESLRVDKTLDGGTVSLLEKHTDFLTGIGVRVQMAEARLDARQSTMDALRGRYDEGAGVALDEEALRLLETEKAYAAAQRVVDIVMHMVDETLRIE